MNRMHVLLIAGFYIGISIASQHDLEYPDITIEWNDNKDDIPIILGESIFCSQEDSSNDESGNRSSTILNQYTEKFKQEWSPKEVGLDNLQHVTFGAKWRGIGFFTPWASPNLYSKLAYFVNNGKREGIDVKINGSWQRTMVQLIQENLQKETISTQDLATVLDALNLCKKDKIHLWTSPYVSKENIEKRKRGEIIPRQKNVVRLAFNKARKNLRKRVKTSIREFNSRINAELISVDRISIQKKVLPDDLINQIKQLYALVDMANQIHEQNFVDYEVCFEKLEKIGEEEILADFDPSILNCIKLTKDYLNTIEISAKKINDVKKQLCEKNATSFEESMVIVANN